MPDMSSIKGKTPKFKGVPRIDAMEKQIAELKQEIVYLNERMDTQEGIHGDIFKVSLDTLKEKRDNLYDSLDDPISDNAKNRINAEIVKIERLISIRMKEVDSHGKDSQKSG